MRINMFKANPIPTLAIGLGVLISECPVRAANGGGHRGGGDTGDIGPACVHMYDQLDSAPLSNVELQLLAGLQDPLMLQSDLFWSGGTVNANDYCDGVDNVHAEITKALGTPPWFLFESKEKEHARFYRRTMFVDFQQGDLDATAGVEGRECMLPSWFNGATTTEQLELNGWETRVEIMKVGNQGDVPEAGSFAFDILAMEVGETRQDVRLLLHLAAHQDGGEDERVIIHFWDRATTPSTDLGYIPPGDRVNVTRLSPKIWLVVVPADRVASVVATDNAVTGGDPATLWLGFYHFPGAFLIYQ